MCKAQNYESWRDATQADLAPTARDSTIWDSMPTLKQRIIILEEKVEKIEKYIRQRKQTKNQENGNFAEFDKLNKERFLEKPKELYLAVDLIYYFRQQSHLAGRPQPIFSWATFRKAEKVCKALLATLPVSRALDYIDYVVQGQKNMENPNIFILTSGWSQRWLNEMDEWLEDRRAARWSKNA